MFLQSYYINKDSYISDIVKCDHRTARVFRKYDIDFCCGGKWPLELICKNKGLESDQLLEELANVSRSVQVPASLNFSSWNVEFLIEYIIKVHHEHLRVVLTEIKEQLEQFIIKHEVKFPQLAELNNVYELLMKDTVPHLLEEEDVIFPYIKQLINAAGEESSYGTLFVRTLRKPLVSFFQNEHVKTGELIQRMRTLTDNYMTPDNACIRHRVLYSLLRDLDNDLVQHLYLENEILFPKAIAIEKELLHAG